MCGAVWSSRAHHFDKNLYCASCLEREAVCGKRMSDLKVTLCVCTRARARTHTHIPKSISGNFLFYFWDTVSHCIWISQIHQDQGHEFQGSSCLCLLSASTIGLPYYACIGLGCLNTSLHTYSASSSPFAFICQPRRGDLHLIRTSCYYEEH